MRLTYKRTYGCSQPALLTLERFGALGAPNLLPSGLFAFCCHLALRPTQATMIQAEFCARADSSAVKGLDAMLWCGMQVEVCPGGQARGYTYCIPSEDRLEAGLLTRSFMETRMVVGMAGRRASGCSAVLSMVSAYEAPASVLR